MRFDPRRVFQTIKSARIDEPVDDHPVPTVPKFDSAPRPPVAEPGPVPPLGDLEKQVAMERLMRQVDEPVGNTDAALGSIAGGIAGPAPRRAEQPPGGNPNKGKELADMSKTPGGAAPAPGMLQQMYDKLGPWGTAGVGAGALAGGYGLYSLLKNRRKPKDEEEKEARAIKIGSYLGSVAAYRAFGYDVK